jgi:hypothetical protein
MSKNRHTVAFGLACGLVLAASAASAQVGTGWTSYSPSFSVQERGCGDVSDLTFRLTCSTTDGDQRAERRYATYTSGQRQFQGYFRITSQGGSRISLKQTFRHNSGAGFMLAVEKGGRLYRVGGDTIAAAPTAAVGTTVRVNTIHNTSTRNHQCYINGSLRHSYTLEYNSEGYYDKFGTYRTGSGYGPITVAWSSIRFFRK